MGFGDRVKLRYTVPAAASTLNELANPKFVTQDKSIPLKLLQHCKGIAFVNIYKAGVAFIGGKIGGGCVIVKVPDSSKPEGFRWSAPCSVSVGGLGGGFVFGGEKISSVIILNTQSAIRGFFGDKQVQFGGSASLALGPTGRDATATLGLSDNKELAPSYSYSIAKGAYIGGTLEGAILKVNESDNHEFYGRAVPSEEILSGKVNPPLACNVLYEALREILASDSNKTSPKIASNSTSPPKMRDLGNSGRALLHSSFGDEDSPSLPDGWQIAYNADSKPYYYDTKGNVSWEKPAMPKSLAPPPPPAPLPARPNQLPPGWTEHATIDGKKYYSNGHTTQWDRPVQ